MRLPILTSVAMLAFAANSVLARLALSNDDIDPLAYTGIRLISGALVLAVILYLRSPNEISKKRVVADNWSAAFALLLYAAAFSIAYVMIDAGPGALILFASVQIGMLAWAVVKGDRPSPLDGLASA